jgi:hypothetical protein
MLDIDKLIAQFGSEHSIVKDKRITAALVCSACGNKGGSLTISGPNLPRS